MQPSAAERAVGASARSGVPAPAYELDWLGGACPVQGTGTCLGGHTLWFRARHDSMRVGISRHPRPDLDAAGREEWCATASAAEAWMLDTRLETDEEAGWIDDATAHAFIAWAVARFRYDVLGQRPGREEAEGWAAAPFRPGGLLEQGPAHGKAQP